jgi:hypothetical protein
MHKPLESFREVMQEGTLCHHSGWASVCCQTILPLLDLCLASIWPFINLNVPFRYSSEEIHFNLMAVVSDRKQVFLREIEALNHQKRQLLEQVTAWGTNIQSCAWVVLWETNPFAFVF